MKICVLTSTYSGSQSPFADYDSDQFHLEEHLGGHEWERHPLKKESSAEQVHDLARKGFDVFMNLCDGAADEDRAGIEVVQALERVNVPYTGADPLFYDPTRERMKDACASMGIKAPRHFHAHNADGIAQAAAILTFPLFVKHPASYGSVGTSRESRVTTPETLRIQAEMMIGEYGGAMIEEYVDGREFTVLVVENADDPARPHAYPPLELHFPPGESFNHFGMKWSDETIDLQYRVVTEEPLSGRLRETASLFFIGMEGTGYGRCDMRMDRTGDLCVLEINPNCTLFGPTTPPVILSADFMILNDPGGYPEFLDRIFKASRRRLR